MADDALRCRLVVDTMISGLTAEHHATTVKLYEAIARENDLPPWLMLDEQARNEIIEEANAYCDAIANDPRIWWAAQVEPLEEVAQLVAEQYDILKRLEEAEAEGATYQPTRH